MLELWCAKRSCRQLAYDCFLGDSDISIKLYNQVNSKNLFSTEISQDKQQKKAFLLHSYFMADMLRFKQRQAISIQLYIGLQQLASTIMKKPQRNVRDEQEHHQQEEDIQQEPNQEQQQNQDAENGEEDVQNDLDEAEMQGDVEDYKNRQNNRGVCYLSRIPPYMKPNYIKKLLNSYLVERVYLLAESEWSRKNRIKKGGNKKICFREGWVEFADKRMAKLAALTLNGQKMVSKKGSFYAEDLWNLKYLPKFKWHHLTERLAHEERLKKERLKVELEQEKKIDEFYSEKLIKSKKINGIIESKKKRGKDEERFENRQFQQIKMASQIKDQ